MSRGGEGRGTRAERANSLPLLHSLRVPASPAAGGFGGFPPDSPFACPLSPQKGSGSGATFFALAAPPSSASLSDLASRRAALRSRPLQPRRSPSLAAEEHLHLRACATSPAAVSVRGVSLASLASPLRLPALAAEEQRQQQQ
jgi:hypothetical protein